MASILKPFIALYAATLVVGMSLGLLGNLSEFETNR